MFLKQKKQTWGLDGKASRSTILNSESDNVNGNKYETDIGKISGTLQYGLSVSGTSPEYDRNDLGYNTQTNIKEYGLYGAYYKNDAWKFISNGSIWFNAFYNTTYTDNAFQSVHFNAGFWTRLTSLWSLNMWTNYRPNSHDYFEPRINGRYLKRPGFYDMGWNVGTDNRKKFRTNVFAFGRKYAEEGMYYYEMGIYPRYRFNDHLTLYGSLSYDKANNTLGWVDEVDAEPIIGRRKRDTYNNVLGMDYTFNHKMSLEFRARHYWSKVRHDDYYGLALDGQLTDSDYNEFSDFSYNAFNIDLNYRWRFAPGSDIILNWKNSIRGGNGDSMIDFEERSYADGIKSLSTLPESNSFSIRIVYFLNAQNIF